MARTEAQARMRVAKLPVGTVPYIACDMTETDDTGGPSDVQFPIAMPEKRQFEASQPSPYEAWVQSMREVPDMLVAAQLSLRPLAKGEAPPTTSEARQIVGDACDLLYLALTNVLKFTRNLPGVVPANADSASPPEAVREPIVDRRMSPRDRRMSPRGPDQRAAANEPRSMVCALTTQLVPQTLQARETARLSDLELDRLSRCANGNTLRFESSEIVAALVAGGYAKEGPGRVVTVTAKGYWYLRSHAARLRLDSPRASAQ